MAAPLSSSPLPELSDAFRSPKRRPALASPTRSPLQPSSPGKHQRIQGQTTVQAAKSSKVSKRRGYLKEPGENLDLANDDAARKVKRLRSEHPQSSLHPLLKAKTAAVPPSSLVEGAGHLPTAICDPLVHVPAPVDPSHIIYHFLHKQPLFEPFVIDSTTYYRNVRTPARGFCGWASASQCLNGSNIGALDIRARTALFMGERSDLTLALLAAQHAQAIHATAFDVALAEMPASRASVTALPDVRHDGGRLADLTLQTAVYLAHALPARVITYLLLDNGVVSQELDVAPHSQVPLPTLRLLLHGQHWEPLLSALPVGAATSWNEITDISPEENLWLNPKQQSKSANEKQEKASAGADQQESDIFNLPDLPRAADFLDAVKEGLAAARISRSLLQAASQYVDSMKQGPSIFALPSASELASEQKEQAALLVQLRAILRKHGLDEGLVRKYRRPSGSVYYAVGCLLFCPPASNRSEETLVRGPGTTGRLLDAGCTTAQFTKDLAEWVYEIPFREGQYGNSPHLSTANLREIPRPAALEIWEVLTRRSKQQYRFRAPRPGIDIVYGKPVRQAWLTATSNLGGGWRRLDFTTRLGVPGATANNITFPPGTASVPSHLFYLPISNGGYRFGKLAAEGGHPCAGTLRIGKGAASSAGDFHNHGALQDVFTDVLVSTSTGRPATRLVRSTFSFLVRPKAAAGEISLKDVTSLRGRERDQQRDFTREELEEHLPGVIDWIETRIPPAQPDDRRSLLLRFCSANTAKSNAAMGASGLSARAKKANASRGVAGRSAAAIKAKQTMGPEGRRAAAKKAQITIGTEGRKAASKKRVGKIGHLELQRMAIKSHVTRRNNQRIVQGYEEATATFTAAVEARIKVAKPTPSRPNKDRRPSYIHENISLLKGLGLDIGTGKAADGTAKSFVKCIPLLKGWPKTLPKKAVSSMKVAQLELLGVLLTAGVITKRNENESDGDDEISAELETSDSGSDVESENSDDAEVRDRE